MVMRRTIKDILVECAHISKTEVVGIAHESIRHGYSFETEYVGYSTGPYGNFESRAGTRKEAALLLLQQLRGALKQASS